MAEKVFSEISDRQVAAGDDDHALGSRRLLLKIDAAMLLQLVVIATLEFLDKNSLAYAAVLGLRTDTHLVGQQYSWLGSIFYFGYLGALPLSAYLVTRVRVGLIVGVSTAAWGICLTCMAACTTFGGLAVVRFFLGVCEASILPCFMNLTAAWYRQREQPLRAAFWYNTFAGIFGGICAYGILDIGGTMAPWRVMFLIYGCITNCGRRPLSIPAVRGPEAGLVPQRGGEDPG